MKSAAATILSPGLPPIPEDEHVFETAEDMLDNAGGPRVVIGAVTKTCTVHVISGAIEPLDKAAKKAARKR